MLCPRFEWEVCTFLGNNSWTVPFYCTCTFSVPSLCTWKTWTEKEPEGRQETEKQKEKEEEEEEEEEEKEEVKLQPACQSSSGEDWDTEEELEEHFL